MNHIFKFISRIITLIVLFATIGYSNDLVSNGINGEDAGYILVNTNKTDILIPEYTTNGKHILKKFIKELNTHNFKLFRYINFQYVVIDNSSRRMLTF